MRDHIWLKVISLAVLLRKIPVKDQDQLSELSTDDFLNDLHTHKFLKRIREGSLTHFIQDLFKYEILKSFPLFSARVLLRQMSSKNSFALFLETGAMFLEMAFFM